MSGGFRASFDGKYRLLSRSMHSEAYLVIDFRSVTFGYLGGCYECMFEGVVPSRS